MPTTETPPAIPEPKLEVFDFLRSNSYRLEGPFSVQSNEDWTKWNIYSNKSQVGLVLYNPDQPDFGLDKGAIHVRYAIRMGTTDPNQRTYISINSDQIVDALKFERFLIESGRPYRSNNSHHLSRIVDFFRRDGLLDRIDDIAGELAETSKAII